MSVAVETVRTVEMPTRLVHGPGAIYRLGEHVRELGVKRPCLVTDGGVVYAGLVDRALETLHEIADTDMDKTPERSAERARADQRGTGVEVRHD
jgi:alcohol dehydrogenase class IV